MSYAGKVAVITGASRGIGRGMAEHFADQGMKLGLCSRTMSSETEGARVSRAVDVRDPQEVSSFCADVATALGPIDLWINNAGLLEPVGPLRELAPGDFETHLAVNVLGVFHGSQAYIRHLREVGRGGVLINISSGAGSSAYAGWAAYCAGKAAVDRMTEVIAAEEAEIGLKAYAVAPGVIDTDMQTVIRSKNEREFPMVDRFIQMKKNDDFSSSSFVAKKTLELAFEGGDDEVIIRFPPGK